MILVWFLVWERCYKTTCRERCKRFPRTRRSAGAGRRCSLRFPRSSDKRVSAFLRRDRSNLLVKTSNNLKNILGVNHFLRGIPVRSIFFEQGKFFQTPCIFAPQFQISYFLGKISDLFLRFIPDPLNFSRKFFRSLMTALDCFFFLHVHEFSCTFQNSSCTVQFLWSVCKIYIRFMRFYAQEKTWIFYCSVFLKWLHWYILRWIQEILKIDLVRILAPL